MQLDDKKINRSTKILMSLTRNTLARRFCTTCQKIIRTPSPPASTK
ncbi:MAG: hypothetical protein IJS69_01655 [Selenomonadaceae bacterium]|nr:hypothetical protein [Selenomonadaceae bacterium]